MIGTLPATLYEPGQFVRLKTAPEWGLGQVQSVAGERVTVNFEHAGKRLVSWFRSSSICRYRDVANFGIGTLVMAGSAELDIVKDEGSAS